MSDYSMLVPPTEITIDEITLPPILLRPLDGEVVSDLQKSIKSVGLLQPILVRKTNSSLYELVFGRHRLEACRKLGWKSIPSIVKQISYNDALLTMVVENIQRNATMNPLSEAKSYIRLIDEGYTISRIAERIGKSDSYVSDRIGLVRRLHPRIAKRFNEENNMYLHPSHLELLAHLKSKQHQLELAHLIERRHLSVRKLEQMITRGHPLKAAIEQKGNSLVIRLPEKIAELSSLHDGDLVYVSIHNRKKIVLEQIPKEVLTAPSVPVKAT